MISFTKLYEKKIKTLLIVSLFLIIGVITCHVTTYKYNFKDSTQKRLTTIVAYVELYNKIHGAYPDSLKQILIYTNGLHEVLDNLPDENRSLSKTKLLTYKKINNGYILFSTGADNLPFTSDDIFPDINELDTSKLGLIIQ